MHQRTTAKAKIKIKYGHQLLFFRADDNLTIKGNHLKNNSISLMFISISLLLMSFIVNSETILINEMLLKSPSPSNCAAVELAEQSWALSNANNLSGRKRFCLRKSIMIAANQQTLKTSLSLTLLGASSIYWDGKLIGENGRVANNQQEEISGLVDYVISVPQALLTPGKHQISIDVSTFNLTQTQSNFLTLRIVETKHAQAFFKRHTVVASLFLGGLFVISLLFQFFYWLYQKRTIYQLFSLLCLLSTLLLFTEESRFIFGYRYHLHLPRLQLMLFFSYIICLLLPFYYLIYYQLNNKFRWCLFNILVLTGLTVWILMNHFTVNITLLFFFTLIVITTINIIALSKNKKNAISHFLIVVSVLSLFTLFPNTPYTDFFSITSIALVLIFTLVLVVLASFIREMKENKTQSLASIRLEAELLKRNMQPHFLTNSLMLVIELIESQPKQAEQFVYALADELKMLVKFSELSEVSLSQEILLCRRHIEIMSYRYQTQFNFEVQGSVDGIFIPPAIIHSQIENSFTHNHIANNSTCTLVVHNDGKNVELILKSPLAKKINVTGLGMGERYIHSRLAEKFGDNYQYTSKEQNNFWLNIINFSCQR